MFYGEYEHAIDRKGRLIIPSRMREVMKEHYVERFFVTRGLDRCLFLFAEDEWRAQEKRFRALSITRREARHFNRFYFSGAVEVTCDKQGRVLIPNYLKDHAGIKRDVMLVGVSSRIEIWDRQEWQKFTTQFRESYEEIAERLLPDGGAGAGAKEEA
ncbi:MAG: cell division/cell wall cluster transcriptional repressor MraZ [Candidatus Omnitrophica bacterium CG11_big_fil_rev_8_21_14_0_20_64_10]|nr:MAG: cell division/cell wall cluster transcriptional repressor MraZ [Candidatus Omnitrophica bacterium CG11_big_fil_rev_8_21_14_0_20_64_10]